MFSNDFFARLRPEVRARRRRGERSRCGPSCRRMRLEPLEDRRMLSLGDLLQTLEDPSTHLHQRYSDFGYAVAADGDLTVVGTPNAGLGGINAGRAYVFNSATGVLVATLENPTPADDDYFGSSVAVSGSTVVVGAHGDCTGASYAGAAYVFDLENLGADPVTLANPTPAEYEYFGGSVAVSGSTVVVGETGYDQTVDEIVYESSGAAYVFDLENLEADPVLLENPTPARHDEFGGSVAVSASTVVVGAMWDCAGGSYAGAAYVFDLSDLAADPVLLQKPTPVAFDYFGHSVAVSGSTVVVGAPHAGGTDAGEAYVFDLDNPEADPVLLENPTGQYQAGFGRSVAVSGSTVVVGAPDYDQTVDEIVYEYSGAAYVFDLDDLGAGPVTLENPTPEYWGEFGGSVAVSGNTGVVGAPGEEGEAGAAYLFDLNNPTTDPLLLENPTPGGYDEFGDSVAVSASTVVVGAPYGEGGAGGVYVFDLESLAADPVMLENPTQAAGDQFASSVAVSGSTVVVGAPGDDAGADDAGAAYVFDLDNPGADPVKLQDPTPGLWENFGCSVAASGSTLVVGARNAQGWAGAAYVFDLENLQADPVLLENPTPGGYGDFGCSVAASGSTLAVGASNAQGGGAVYVFDLENLEADPVTLENPTPATNDWFGSSVAVSGSTVVVGASGDGTGASHAGAAYVFDLENLAAGPVTLENPTPAEYERFGSSVAVLGSTVLVGAPYDNAGETYAGAAYVFDVATPGEPLLVHMLENPTPAYDDDFGSSVAVLGSVALVGAPGEDGFTVDRGAVYLFDITADTCVALSGEDLLILDHAPGGKDDALTLSLDTSPEPDELVIHDPNAVLGTGIPGASADGTHTIRVPVTAFSGQILVNTLEGDDSLAVDFSGGDPLGAGGLAYDGGTNGAAGDKLRVIGTPALSAAYLPDGATTGNGSVEVLDSGTTGHITFTGLEPVDVSRMQAVSLVTPRGSDSLTVAADSVGGVDATTISGTSGGVAFESLTVYDVTDLVLALDADPHAIDHDEVLLTGANVARGLESITMQLGTGADDVEVTGVVDLGSGGRLRATGEMVNVTLGGGQITADRLVLPTDAKLIATGTVDAQLVGVDRIEATGALALGTGGPGGFSFDGTLMVGAHNVTLSAADFARLGAVTTIDGGVLSAPGGIGLGLGCTLQGTGTVAGRVAAQVGSTIIAAGDLVLGDANAYDGLVSDGTLYVEAHNVTIHDRNEGVLGSLTEIGDGTGPGTLSAPHGLLLENGKTLHGYGVVNHAFENQGHVIGEGPQQDHELDLTGDVTGSGSFDGNITFSGTYSPGNSPAEVPFGGNVAFAPSATLYVEIGGPAAGAESDRLDVTGQAQLGGELVVNLIDDYVPAAGDVFEIVGTGGGVLGTFATESLPALPPDQAWRVDYSPDAITLRVELPSTTHMQAVLRAADTGLPADPNGEAENLPESLQWVDEWDSFWIEIWGRTPDTDAYGIGSFSVDLVYNTDLFTATTIQYGPAFTEDRTGTIDDAAGRVDQIGARTTQADVGDDQNVLLARVFFEPMSCDAGCAHNADGRYVTPVEGLGLAFEDAGVELVGVGQATVRLGDSPATDSWPVIYDVDDDGQIGFGDLAFFATAFQQSVGDPGADFAWACDFDHSGKVDVGDLAFFAENFQRMPGSPMVYPGNFPDDWQDGTQAAGMQEPAAAGIQELAAAEGLRAPDPAFLSACCVWDFDTLEAASTNSSDAKDAEAVDFLIAHGYW